MSTSQRDVAMSKQLLEDVNIHCTKFFNEFPNNSYSWPFLIYRARERDFKAISQQRRRVKDTSEYKHAPSSTQQRLLNEVREQVNLTRIQNGLDWRSLGRSLGNEEFSGKFAFERSNGHLRGLKASDCLLCGLHGHGIVECPEYLKAYEKKRGRLHQPQASASDSITNSSYSNALITNNRPDVISNANATAHDQHFYIQSSFSGYVTRSTEGQLSNVECRRTSEQSQDRNRWTNLSGGDFTAQEAQFVSPSEMRRAMDHVEYDRYQEDKHDEAELEDPSADSRQEDEYGNVGQNNVHSDEGRATIMSEIQILKAAGWRPERWVNECCNSTNGIFTNPLLLQQARDRGYSAVTNARYRVIHSNQYQYAANPDVQQQLLAAVKPGIIQKRISTGEDFRSVARKLGHIETEGKFAFEAKGRRLKRFEIGDCILCGISGHGVLECGEYRKAEALKRRSRGPQGRQISAHEEFVEYGSNGIYNNPAADNGRTVSYNLGIYHATSPQERVYENGVHEDIVHDGKDGDTQMRHEDTMYGGRDRDPQMRLEDILHGGGDRDTQMQVNWDANIDPSLRSL